MNGSFQNFETEKQTLFMVSNKVREKKRLAGTPPPFRDTVPNLSTPNTDLINMKVKMTSVFLG